MATGFRSKMTWLHTWSGLILGWLLFAIFVTGTSAYYRGEITLWMKPELHKSQVSEKTFEVAIDKALESSKKFTNVNVSLPSSRTNLISIREDGAILKKNTNEQKNVNASKDNRADNNTRGQRQFGKNTQNVDKASQKRNKGEASQGGIEQKNSGSAKAAQQRKGKKRRVPPKYYDATTGELIKETTNTAGGNFLYRFHFELYSIPREIGRWIVGIASIAMLVAIFTGIIIHKRIFKDIFTFRNKHTTRGWMDAHILPAVASIPFLIMITYSGLLLLGNTLMPWGMKMYYGDDFLAYRNDRGQIGKSSQKLEEVKKSIKSDVLSKNSNQKNQEYINENSNTNRILNANTQKYIKKYNNKNAYRILNASMNKSINVHNKAFESKEIKELSKSKLINILDDAQKIWPNNVGRFSIKKDTNKNTIVVEVSPKNPTTLFSFKGSREMAVYNGLSGELLETSTPPNGDSITANTNIALFSLHQALFADPFLRFIFFISGLIGVVLSGTGLILWVQKRKKKELTRNSFGFKLVDKLNVGTIIGIFIAIAVYFIVNRVTTTSNKEELEIGGFFIAWGLSYIYAFVRDTKKAWLEQTIIAIVLYAMLPIINAITTFDSFSQIYSRDNILIYFDVFFIFTALVFALIAFILIRKSRKGVK
ncbi:PepSY-associated TM helix domain-containing protein [Halarcobacter sp.]|uniref:PepSY-associated TM helix domain-containing protein n=1 Tax=Halarcobacter sp. TaxID=2321133 RepID=UPI0029F4B128|nr:PepSY-associated TM helix domain-containing protein [Halarcobacter sp.]